MHFFLNFFVCIQIEYSIPLLVTKIRIRIPDISATVAQIQKIKKTRCIYFQIWLLGGPSHPVNWSPTHLTGPQTPFFTDISVSVAQIQKNKKTRCIFSRILLLGGPSPPSQLVPNPFLEPKCIFIGPRCPWSDLWV